MAKQKSVKSKVGHSSKSTRPMARGSVSSKGRRSVAERAAAKAARREKRRAYKSVSRPTGVVKTAEMQGRLDSLAQKLESLRVAATLADVNEDLADVDTVLAVLPADVEALRTRGYVFASFLERKVQALADKWDEVRERVVGDVDRRSRQLEREVSRAESALRRAEAGGASRISAAESAVEALESKVSAAQKAVEARFDALDDNVTQTQAQVEAIEWALDQADQATVGFYPAEDLVAACKAQFLETKKDGPEGVLFLTDERLIFERKEEVATKKVLFVTTEKETVQESLLEVPVGQIEKVKPSEAGLLGHKEMLELSFSRDAPLSKARLRLLDADSEEWAGLIGRVRSGDIAKERTRPKEETAEEEARQVPTKCPTCGAQITVSVVKGMREVTCEYCGAVIRL